MRSVPVPLPASSMTIRNPSAARFSITSSSQAMARPCNISKWRLGRCELHRRCGAEFHAPQEDHNYTRGYEWWLMEEAHKRNPQIILDALPWGAPGWVGSGHFYTPDMADYVADFLQGAQKQHHLDIAYTGIWNEKQFDSTYVKELFRTLAAQRIPAKIVCCDEYPGEGLGQWSIVDAMLKDAELKPRSTRSACITRSWTGNTPLLRCANHRQTTVVQRRPTEHRRRSHRFPRVAHRRTHSGASL